MIFVLHYGKHACVQKVNYWIVSPYAFVRDEIECTYPSDTSYGFMDSAHKTSANCFPEGNVWKNFFSEDSLRQVSSQNQEERHVEYGDL